MERKNATKFLQSLIFCLALLLTCESSKAIAEIKRSNEMGYPAATFALATAYFLGDDVQQNHAKAEVLFFQAYNKSVFWAARGLSSLYSDEFSDLFDEQKASEWASKFDAETKKD